jgi:hypothetical protein
MLLGGAPKYTEPNWKIDCAGTSNVAAPPHALTGFDQPRRLQLKFERVARPRRLARLLDASCLSLNA